jgi:hypothetical protein
MLVSAGLITTDTSCAVCGHVQGGGLSLLLDLLESRHINLQHNAAFALYGISDNEDNIPCIIQVGVMQHCLLGSRQSTEAACCAWYAAFEDAQH